MKYGNKPHFCFREQALPVFAARLERGERGADGDEVGKEGGGGGKLSS